MWPVCRDSGHTMCHPTKSEGARPVGVSRVVKSWSPFQIVRSINKKIINNGADLSKKIVRVTGKAKNKGKCPRTMHNVGCPGYPKLNNVQYFSCDSSKIGFQPHVCQSYPSSLLLFLYSSAPSSHRNPGIHFTL